MLFTIDPFQGSPDVDGVALYSHVAEMGFSTNEQVTQESTVDVAQKPKKPCSREAKIGRLKYNQFLLRRVLAGVRAVGEMQRIILNGLKSAGYFHFDVPLTEKLACEDELDREILECVHEAGREGVFPKDVAASLPLHKDSNGQPIRHYHVSRRIQRMNKRLTHETGEKLFEKRGWKWALTQFGFETYGDVERETLGDFNVEKE
jgi:hypothetical protein